jgi:hypothetical protein
MTLTPLFLPSRSHLDRFLVLLGSDMILSVEILMYSCNVYLAHFTSSLPHAVGKLRSSFVLFVFFSAQRYSNSLGTIQELEHIEHVRDR